MISGEEFKRRLDRISQLRAMILDLRRAAQRAYDAGECSIRPAYDIRSDVEYWKKLADEQGVLD